MDRVLLAVVIAVVAAVVALVLRRRARPDAPTQPRGRVPEQLDRRDFDAAGRPVAGGRVHVGRRATPAPTSSARRRCWRATRWPSPTIEYPARSGAPRALPRSTPCPLVVIADADGVVRQRSSARSPPPTSGPPSPRPARSTPSADVRLARRPMRSARRRDVRFAVGEVFGLGVEDVHRHAVARRPTRSRPCWIRRATSRPSIVSCSSSASATRSRPRRCLVSRLAGPLLLLGEDAGDLLVEQPGGVVAVLAAARSSGPRRGTPAAGCSTPSGRRGRSCPTRAPSGGRCRWPARGRWRRRC